MDFNLDDDQRMLDDMVRRVLAKEYSLKQRAVITESALGTSPAVWAQFAELGLLGLNVPLDCGGLGASPLETLIVMEAFGAALVVEPYLSTCVVGARLLATAGTTAQRDTHLAGIAAGSWKCAIAALEPDSGFDLDAVKTMAVRAGDAWVINGSKTVVLHGNCADAFIVSANTDVGGLISLFLIDAGTPGLRTRHFPTLDGQRISELTLEDVQVSATALLGSEGGGAETLDHAIDFGIAALCSEAVGAAARLLDMTLEYVRSRKQFGQAIGRFQAVAHRVAEMQSAIEQARSITLQAFASVDADPRQRRLAICAAKTLVGEAGRFVGEQAVQLHGGIGMTDELPVGRYLKRLTAIDMTWGSADHHVGRYSLAMQGPEVYWAFDETEAFDMAASASVNGASA